jgi:hypothetical protein
MIKLSRWTPKRCSTILGGFVLVAPLLFLGILKAQTPQFPNTITYNSNVCPAGLVLCIDCNNVGLPATACQFDRPAAGWTMKACVGQVGLARCKETFFDCGTIIDCFSGLPVGGNCSNNRWCQ